MATTTAQTTDVTAVLEELLKDVENLRVYTMLLDTVRPPAVVIAQPTLTFNDPTAGFCAAIWDFGLTAIVSRNNDRAAQTALSQLVLDIVQALDGDADGVLSIETQTAIPVAVSLNGADLPAYTIRVRIRA